MRRRILAGILPGAGLWIGAPPAFADPDVGPGNSNKGVPTIGGAKCHPAGQTETLRAAGTTPRNPMPGTSPPWRQSRPFGRRAKPAPSAPEFRARPLARIGDPSGDELQEELDEAIGAHMVADVPGARTRWRILPGLVKDAL
jgi:hypothetical protein